MEKAPAQEGIGQLFFIVGGDEHDGPVLGFDQFTCLINKELHAVEFPQQVIGELDVRLVDLVNQQYHGLVVGECLPQRSLDDVVRDVLDALVSKLRVAQARHGIIFIETLLRLCGRFDVPFKKRHAERTGDFLSQFCLAGSGLALDQQWAFQCDGCVDREHEIISGDIGGGALEAHDGSLAFRE